MTLRVFRLFLLVLGLGLSLSACSGNPSGDDDDSSESGDDDDSTEPADPCAGITPAVTDLELAELAARLDDPDDDLILINVHVPYAGDIVGTDANIAFTDIDAIEEFLDHNLGAEVVLYCLTGPMSATAAAELVDRGYCAVYDLPDGLFHWYDSGYPTESWGG